MKAFTDLEQSKKLAEFLPLESADMYFEKGIGDNYKEAFGNLADMQIAEIMLGIKTIPCWSLAALYSILPNNEKESTTLSRGGWRIEPIEYIDNWWCEYEDDSHSEDFTVSADNPVDACVAMIIKLHEQKLL